MTSRGPTQDEIDELVAFLPRLYGADTKPVKQWHGGTKNEKGEVAMPWPEYSSAVADFFHAASKECWSDHGYARGHARQLLEDPTLIKKADLAQIKTMLTFCVRGERFCDGHWAAMIENGYIRQLLQRLQVIRENR